MAIETSIIDSGPTSRREDNKQLYIKRVGAIPPNSYTQLVDGIAVTITQTPEIVGQFVYYRPFNRPTYDRRVTMYVVIDIPGEGLQWKEVVHEAVFTNLNTGQEWDPLYLLPGA